MSPRPAWTPRPAGSSGRRSIELAGQGLTFLIATHYMDEAERCHRLAFILNGNLLAHGTVAEVIEQAHLTTWSVSGPDLLGAGRAAPRHVPAWSRRSRSATCCTSAAPTPAALERAIAPFRTKPYEWRRIDSGLEDVFIHFMEPIEGRGVVMRRQCEFSLRRFWAIVVKEFIQMRRDRLTFGMMIGIPLMQLILFGFAINSDPKHLPAAVLLADHGPQGRTLLHAIRNSSYFDFVRELDTEAGGPRRARPRRGPVRRQHPGELHPRSAPRRPARAAVEADATDPAATGNAVSTCASLLNTRHAARFQRPARLPGRAARTRSTCASTRSTTRKGSPSTTSCRA